MSVKWRVIDCPRCGGHGVISVYTLGGTDFLGAGECPKCGGNGVLWISPKDRIADNPGGPFRGSWPGAFEKAREREG